jgi:hypothetical protein
LAQLQRQAEQVVDAALIGQARQPFDEAGNPASPFARLIANGQQAMVDLALERSGRILDARLPEDLQRQLSVREPLR